MEGELLYRLVQGPAKLIEKRLCVPTALRPAIAIALHDMNCHIGLSRLVMTTKTRYYFPSMYRFLGDHVRSCEVCGRVQGVGIKAPITHMPIVRVGQRWIIDYHGEYPVTTSGFKFVLVCIDSTSLFVELLPAKTTSALETIQLLHDAIVCRYGIMKDTFF